MEFSNAGHVAVTFIFHAISHTESQLMTGHVVFRVLADCDG